MRVNLKVPFAEKDEAKKLGARWDAARKLWYIENKTDLAPFLKWSPAPHDASAAPPLSQKGGSARPQQSAGKVIVGSEYTALPRVCDCLPWDVCDKCRPLALSR